VAIAADRRLLYDSAIWRWLLMLGQPLIGKPAITAANRAGDAIPLESRARNHSSSRKKKATALMKSFCAWLLLSAAVASSAGAANSLRPFTGTDLSGVYDCTGRDAHDGAFKATVTLKLDDTNSTGKFGGYAYQMQVEGFGLYLGSAASEGNHLAITFANEDPAKEDYGTGIATVTRNKAGIKLEKYYYQPQYESGNHGFETCVRQGSAAR
jgi:hypothetical protein